MKMPGFTAEASLCRSREYYQMPESLEQIDREVQLAATQVYNPKASMCTAYGCGRKIYLEICGQADINTPIFCPRSRFMCDKIVCQ